MNIKEVAKKTGVSIDNLRYYERIGLIPPIKRTRAGIRDYDERAIHWVELVLKFKKAGASLEFIKEYLHLANEGKSTKEARRGILFEIKTNIEEQMQELQKCYDMINYKIENYDDLCEPVTTEIIGQWKSSDNKDE
ncbi:MerR family transcriptional regulator [Clostridium folliculivorans]|uniref:MerR family transcriptional regulator n=1 Tax=Clostridium folliculivorans TaxID=2886038 RepID=A0A9W5Y093_9CLOT|nr:MerR family transcriptional regulator [Clostridium folliculivorans]GKU24253.1 MerR family transcriptional regulator [Clostridium folliculivorans]GKU30358.1 MerR family transcriptional regulator [Clostridium folliculivorans]